MCSELFIQSLFGDVTFVLKHCILSVLVQANKEQEAKVEEEEELSGEEQSCRRQVLLGTLITSVVLPVTIYVLSCDI